MKYAPPIGMEAQGEDAHYVDGNPELGILGSPVPAAAVEQGQREILEVIKQAGLTPSSEDLTQLFQAIGMLIGKRVPIATKEKAGIVKPGAGMEIKEDGTLNVLVSVVMPGVVVAFSGAFGGEGNRHPIPLGATEPDTGWLLCDGGSDGKGGTVPNLLGRMILGASESRPAGSTGGSETHTHSLSGTVGATTTSLTQTAAHGHPATITAGAWDGFNGMTTVPFGSGVDGRATLPASPSVANTGSSQSHTHSLTATTGTASSLPPYYALAYIMRIA
ncbi:hypothetical protein [uncultured Desulfovibrio sp.]|uniref:hypothetical protein n=1 Tax=uncultured Desulfovibrio sp. TaxID=167968 RepID=UPI002608BFF4|nr:hypothetical protein [uncultured Desulfovibrio sp.]